MVNSALVPCDGPVSYPRRHARLGGSAWVPDGRSLRQSGPVPGPRRRSGDRSGV